MPKTRHFCPNLALPTPLLDGLLAILYSWRLPQPNLERRPSRRGRNEVDQKQHSLDHRRGKLLKVDVNRVWRRRKTLVG
jgi:hypothetical protein